MIDEVISNSWIDAQSSDIYIDFVTYNGNADLFTYVAAHFSVTPTGYVENELEMETVDFEPYKNAGDWVRGFFEMIFLICSIFYVAIMVREIKLIIAGNVKKEASKS
jgi:hypothetical protein